MTLAGPPVANTVAGYLQLFLLPVTVALLIWAIKAVIQLMVEVRLVKHEVLPADRPSMADRIEALAIDVGVIMRIYGRTPTQPPTPAQHDNTGSTP